MHTVHFNLKANYYASSIAETFSYLSSVNFITCVNIYILLKVHLEQREEGNKSAHKYIHTLNEVEK